MHKLAIITTSAFASLGMATGVASAQSTPEYHGELAYAFVDIENANLHALGGRGSVYFNDHFGLEAEGFFGIADDEVSIQNVNVDVDLNYLLGAYATLRTNVTENTELFGRLGYATLELEASASGVSVEGDDDSTVFGVGIRHFYGGGANGVRADVTVTEEGFDQALYGLSYVRKF